MEHDPHEVTEARVVEDGVVGQAGANHVDLEEELASISGVVSQLQDECDGASKGKGESDEERSSSIGSEVVEGADRTIRKSWNRGTDVAIATVVAAVIIAVVTTVYVAAVVATAGLCCHLLASAYPLLLCSFTPPSLPSLRRRYLLPPASTVCCFLEAFSAQPWTLLGM